MAKLSSLTDAYDQLSGLPVERLYVSPANNNTPDNFVSPQTETPYTPSDDTTNQPNVLARIINRLTGTNGEERYQTWPEKIIRSGVTAAGDALAGNIPQYAVDPQSGDVHTSPEMIQRGLDMSAVAGIGGLAGVPEDASAALGSAPFLRPALKYNNKIYKAPVGSTEHSDAIPTHLQDDFYKKAMTGEDINDYQFGFMNHKGQFLDREKALDYGIKEGLIDPSAGRYGVLTSTMLSDSSKPGVAIEAARNAEPFYQDALTKGFPLFSNPIPIPNQRKD